MSTKQYFAGSSQDPNDEHRADYWFWPEVSRAYHFSESDAQSARITYNNLGVYVHSAAFEQHRCVFELERIGLDDFVLFCEMPFEPTHDNPAERMNTKSKVVGTGQLAE